jgi:hypothetical protein
VKGIFVISTIILSLIVIGGVAYSFCVGPSFDCMTCPACGASGQVFQTQELNTMPKTCVYTPKCWRGHVWSCAR